MEIVTISYTWSSTAVPTRFDRSINVMLKRSQNQPRGNQVLTTHWDIMRVSDQFVNHTELSRAINFTVNTSVCYRNFERFIYLMQVPNMKILKNNNNNNNKAL